ncbi:hypothetical protein [Staphylococcus aureus]
MPTTFGGEPLKWFYPF